MSPVHIRICAGLCAALAALLAGCASAPSGPQLPHYRCEAGVEFTVRFVDDSALLHNAVYVSAGRRGADISLAPGDLVSITRAMTAEIRAVA